MKQIINLLFGSRFSIRRNPFSSQNFLLKMSQIYKFEVPQTYDSAFDLTILMRVLLENPYTENLHPQTPMLKIYTPTERVMCLRIENFYAS